MLELPAFRLPLAPLLGHQPNLRLPYPSSRPERWPTELNLISTSRIHSLFYLDCASGTRVSRRLYFAKTPSNGPTPIATPRYPWSQVLCYDSLSALGTTGQPFPRYSILSIHQAVRPKFIVFKAVWSPPSIKHIQPLFPTNGKWVRVTFVAGNGRLIG